MPRFLIPLLAALALPTDVNAESVWLLLRAGDPLDAATMEKIEMKDMQQCELMGSLFNNYLSQRK